MANRSRIHRPARSTIVLGSRLRELTTRVKANPAVQRVGKWIDNLQADLRDSASQRIHEAGTLASRVARRLLSSSPTGPRAIVNATGILNLRGAELPLADDAIDAIELVAREYRTCHARTSRAITASAQAAHSGTAYLGAAQKGYSQADPAHSIPAADDAALRSVESLVSELTGAEAALVFSNPGTALVALLAALARGHETLVSRSHVERLQGDFALPAAAEMAKVTLREVGTTHRTTADDYRRAISPQTALILHSQPAEFQIIGAACQPGLDELATLATQREVPLVAYLPAASLISLGYAGALHLPLVGQSIVAGADLVIFRGDTCLGGPTSAIVAGRRELVERIAAEPLSTVLAADTFTLAALAATLRLSTAPETALRSIPLVQLLAASSDNLKHRAERLAPQIRRSSLVTRVEVLPGAAWLSEARLPDERLSSWCLRIESRGTSAARLAGDLADRAPAVWAQAEDNYLWINLRSVLPRQDEQIVAAFHGLGTRAADSHEPAGEPREAVAASTTDVLNNAE